MKLRSTLASALALSTLCMPLHANDWSTDKLDLGEPSKYADFIHRMRSGLMVIEFTLTNEFRSTTTVRKYVDLQNYVASGGGDITEQYAPDRNICDPPVELPTVPVFPPTPPPPASFVVPAYVSQFDMYLAPENGAPNWLRRLTWTRTVTQDANGAWQHGEWQGPIIRDIHGGVPQAQDPVTSADCDTVGQ